MSCCLTIVLNTILCVSNHLKYKSMYTGSPLVRLMAHLSLIETTRLWSGLSDCSPESDLDHRHWIGKICQNISVLIRFPKFFIVPSREFQSNRCLFIHFKNGFYLFLWNELFICIMTSGPLYSSRGKWILFPSLCFFSISVYESSSVRRCVLKCNIICVNITKHNQLHQLKQMHAKHREECSSPSK